MAAENVQPSESDEHAQPSALGPGSAMGTQDDYVLTSSDEFAALVAAAKGN